MKTLLSAPNIRAIYMALKTHGCDIKTTADVAVLISDINNSAGSRSSLTGWLYRELKVNKLRLTNNSWCVAERAYVAANNKREQTGQKVIPPHYLLILHDMEQHFS